MIRGRKHKRRDGNHDEIVSTLRRCGCTVVELHQVGGGVPDLLVGKGGVNYLIEAKPPGSVLRANQSDWHLSWRGQVAVVTEPTTALQIVGLVRV